MARGAFRDVCRDDACVNGLLLLPALAVEAGHQFHRTRKWNWSWCWIVLVLAGFATFSRHQPLGWRELFPPYADIRRTVFRNCAGPAVGRYRTRNHRPGPSAEPGQHGRCRRAFIYRVNTRLRDDQLDSASACVCHMDASGLPACAWPDERHLSSEHRRVTRSRVFRIVILFAILAVKTRLVRHPERVEPDVLCFLCHPVRARLVGLLKRWEGRPPVVPINGT